MDNFWNTEKGKATIKMGLWLVFIIILIAIFAIGGNSNTSYNNTISDEEDEVVEEYTFKTFDEMKNNLLNNNYEYVYDVKTLDKEYIFSGVKYNDEELGYKESSEEVIKYYINEDKYYKVILNDLEEIDNLYESINSSFINMKLLFDNLNNYLYSVSKVEDMRTITYDKEGYSVVVKTNLENITSITIVEEDTTYNLEFTKIGECARISLTDN